MLHIKVCFLVYCVDFFFCKYFIFKKYERRVADTTSRSILVNRGNKYDILNVYLDIVASYGAGSEVCDCKRDRLWVRFPIEEMKYLIFSR